MGTLKIALYTIIRNPRRTLTLGLGIIVVTAFISGVFLATDYLGQEFLAEVLEHVDVDIEITIAHKNVSGYKDVVKELEKIEGVEKVEPYIVKPYDFPYDGPYHYHVEFEYNFKITKNGELLYPVYQYVTSGQEVHKEPVYFLCIYGFRQNMSIGEMEIVNGSLNLTGNNIAIVEDSAKILNLKPGDNITLTLIRRFKPKKLNVTICATIEFKGELRKLIIERHSFFTEKKILYLVMPIELAYQFFKRSSSLYREHGFWVNYWVFVNREKLLSPWDPDKSIEKLRKLEVKIRDVCITNRENYAIENHLETVMMVYKTELRFLKYSVGLISLPSFFLAWFFILISNWISVNERRREIGLLKIRGATNRQIFLSLLLEALVIGSIGGLIGVGMGCAISMQLAEFLATRPLTLIPWQIFIKLLPFYIQFSIILGIIFASLAAILPARKVTRMETQKLLQEYLEEVEAEKWKPKLAFAMFIIGLIKTVEIILGLSVPAIIARIELQSENVFLTLLFMALSFIDIILYFLGPLLFIYGLSKIITHYATKFDKPFKAVVKPLLGELSDIAVKNFTRKATRTTRILFLLTITLTYGVTMIIGTASLHKYMIETTKIEVGADIKAYPVYPLNETQLITNISNIDEVSLIATIRKYQYVKAIEGENTELLIIDKNYFNVSYIEEKYLEGASLDEVYSKFRSGENCCMISKYLSRTYMFDIGDKIRLSFTINKQEITIDLTVIAIAKILPGVGYISEPYYNPMIIISYQCAQKCFNPQEITPIQLLIDLKEKANSTEIAEKLEKEYLEIHSVTFPENEIQKQINNPFYIFFSKLFFIQVVFASLVAVLGLSLIMTMATLERQREIGLLVARGLSKKQTIKVFLGEALLIILISFSLGILEGVSVIFGTLNSLMMTFSDFPLKIPLVFPPKFYLFLTVELVTLILSSIFPAWHLTKKNVAKILRIHH